MKKQDFNTDWLFSDAGSSNKTMVTLPHDAMIQQTREPECKSGSAQAFFPGGAYIYEKTFDFSTEWQGKHIAIQFEGVYKNAKVFINGKAAGGAVYGYIPFFIVADSFLKEGENVLRVECENLQQPDSRWYTGAGIYRPVWLWIGEKVHIDPEGIRIRTVSYKQPQIHVDVVHNGGNECEICVEILDNGCVVAQGAPGDIAIHDGKLWSDESPYLYTCRVTLKREGNICDIAETHFGIRKVEWSPKGLFVNGCKTLLRGGCVHHDHGILGAATHDESEYRRAGKLKAAGYNAIRSSHNPASRALLDACDELGLYVIDESWDMWFHHKNQYDYATEWRANYKSDLKAIVDRDYNHPSVIFYSVGNEVSEPATEEGLRVLQEMKDYLHSLDGERAVTAGFNLMIINSAKKGKGIYDDEKGGRKNDNDKKMSGMNSTMFNMITSMVGTNMNKSANSKEADDATSPALEILDIAGYNYSSGRYPLEEKAHPERVIYGSETFPQDIVKNWEMVKKYPYLIGDFMWTAWDYLGEVGLGAWAYTTDGKSFNKPYPWLVADCGAFDILGNPGAPVAYAQAAWGLDTVPWIGVQPLNHPDVEPAKAVWRGSNAINSWSWKGCEGNKAIVEIYSSASKVELILNGKSLGKKKTEHCKAVFKTRYAPGKLEAVAYSASGEECGHSELNSAQTQLAINMCPEKEHVKVGEVCYIDLQIADLHHTIESNADEVVSVTVENGELLAFGSANPRTEESFDSGHYTTYYGRALIAVKATTTERVRVTAEALSGKTAIDISVNHS